MGFAPKVANFDHKELDIAPTEGCTSTIRWILPPQRWVLTNVRLILTCHRPLTTIRWIKSLCDIWIIRLLLQLLALVIKLLVDFVAARVDLVDIKVGCAVARAVLAATMVVGKALAIHKVLVERKVDDVHNATVGKSLMELVEF